MCVLKGERRLPSADLLAAADAALYQTGHNGPSSLALTSH